MGLFGLFGGKEKKNKEINNSNKKQIIMLIQNLQMNCKNADATSLLRSIQTELQSQGETSDENVFAIDAEIKRLLTESNTYILKGQYPTVISKLGKAMDRAAERHQYCVAGGQMTKKDAAAAEKAKKMFERISGKITKTHAEELQDEIDSKNAEYDQLNAEYERLKELHKSNPNNASITAQATAVVTKMRALRTVIDNLSVALSQETVETSIVDIAATNKTIEQHRTHSDAEMDVMRATVAAQNEQLGNTKAQIASDMGLLSSTGGAADPFADDALFGASNSAQQAAADPFAEGAVFGTANGAATADSSRYGAFNAAAVGTADMANEIRKAMQAVQASIDQYEDKVDDANEDLQDYNAQLRPLLERRKSASPSDCLVLDGQIDQINAKRGSVVYKIKRYRQVMAQLSDKLSILEKLSTQQDLTATNAKIEQLTNGQFSDLSGLSVFLYDSVKKSNEQLEEIGMAADVAQSEEIIMNSHTGAAAALSDAATSKDEHKYDSLEQELATPAKLSR